MFADIIMFLFVFFYTITICQKLMNTHLVSTLYIFLISICLTMLSIILKSQSSKLTYAIPLLFICLFISVLTETPKNSFLFSVISLGISYSFWGFSCIIIVIMISAFIKPLPIFNPNITAPFVAVLGSILVRIFFKIKRFRKGMPFLFTSTILNFAFLMCIVFISFLICRPILTIDRPLKNSLFIIFVLFFFILIHWWQAQITKSYKQALVQRELESLRTELQEKDKLLKELSTRNEELGRLIHKDNKRIPAMEHAVSEFLVMDFDDKEHAINRANTLLLEIQELSNDRNNVITEIYARKYKQHSTGISALDTMLNYMEKRAYGEHIKLSVQTAINLHDFIPSNITAEDISHVLSDLLENAIIAVKEHKNPIIQLQFYQAGKDFVVEIADNGIPFETTSLTNFGLEQLTTHADTGGSGIGLMDIWKIKEKYGASLHIAEYDNNAPYTKKMALIFNKKNRYTISTTRKDELLQLSKRTDLQIF